MKLYTKIFWSVAGLIILPFLIICIYTYYALRIDHERLDEQKKQILYETNHEQLLDDCREIIRKAQAGKIPTGSYLLRNYQGTKLPESILAIDPMRIDIEKNYLDILIHSGAWYSCGILAFPEGSDESNS